MLYPIPYYYVKTNISSKRVFELTSFLLDKTLEWLNIFSLIHKDNLCDCLGGKEQVVSAQAPGHGARGAPQALQEPCRARQSGK